MEEKHRELVEEIFSHVSFTLTERGTVNPLFIMLLPDNSTMPIIAHGEGLTLDLYSNAAHSAAHEMQAKALMLVSEQHMVTKKKDDVELDALMDGSIRPSEHPDAEDYLTLSFMSAHGDCSSLIAKIHKDPMGTKYTNEREWIDNSTSALLVPWKEGN